MRDITVSKRIFKPEGAVKERFASCIVVRSVVDFRLIMVEKVSYNRFKL